MELFAKVLAQNKWVQGFFLVVGGAFTAVMVWGFIVAILQSMGGGGAFVDPIPSDLKTMTLAVYGMIAAGWNKGKDAAISAVEKISGLDLSGAKSTPAAAEAAQPIITETPVAAEPVAVQVQAAVTSALGPTATGGRFGPP